eukprot:TRINITY_DN41048_c0_g1_i1.p2 TRINITY_DN41048_c0_g1~~TRINITY_DN41048_c0_g1_i1.p2  ORF type:complete len:158 (+),score=12.92 TRINITY_DN41048_c0_g1_i1:112-585(+)
MLLLVVLFYNANIYFICYQKQGLIMRTMYCGEVTEAVIGQEIELVGWVNKQRDLGGVIFLDMRDRAGIVQVLFDADTPEATALAATTRNEFCIKIKGLVRPRPEGQVNKEMTTGGIEILGLALEILNRSEPSPPCTCLLYTSPSPRDRQKSRMPSSA